MASLKDRLAEVMAACAWDRSDVVRISGQSSSVVSQWLGHGSKEIKKIGKLEAVLRLERESGFSALWIAEGKGPKRAGVTGASNSVVAREHAPHYGSRPAVLQQLAEILSTVPASERAAVASNLHGLAMDGGAAHWLTALNALLIKRAA